MVNAVLLQDIDMVATVSTQITAGDNVTYILNGQPSTIIATNNIPINHKIAVKIAKKGDAILKYGEKIGYALTDIELGEHVHVHNLDSKI